MRLLNQLPLALLAIFFLTLPSLAQEAADVQIKGDDQMKFDVTSFTVKAGQKVSVTLTNVGTMPKAAMGHNFVLLQPGTDVNDFSMKGIPHAATDYVAPEHASKVLIATKLLGPGEKETVTFTAPTAGKYDFVCTFPGHALTGMRGVMTVE